MNQAANWEPRNITRHRQKI